MWPRWCSTLWEKMKRLADLIDEGMRGEKESDCKWVALSATLWEIKLELELESGTVTVSSL